MSNIQNLNNQVLQLIEETSKVISNTKYLSRLETALEKPFKVIDSNKMDYILDKTKEINEKIYNFSKQNTQASHKLMTLTMLFPADSVYRQLQQIAAQIERKQTAITENMAKLKKKQLKLKKNKIKIEQLTEELKNLTDEYKIKLIEIDIEELELDIQEIQIGIANSLSYIEAALKEIGYLSEAYEQIKRNKNIPDDWDEYDVEKEEVLTNVKNAFRLGLRDFLVSGRIGMGTCEYFEQFGISPMEAIREITDFINYTNIHMREGNQENVDFDVMYEWLNAMTDKYRNHYLKAVEKIGIDKGLISKQFTLTSDRNLKEVEGYMSPEELK